MSMKAKQTDTELHVTEIKTGTLSVCIIGTSPLVYNAVSFKAQGTLLLPSGRMTAADKQQNLKHNPLEEYRNSTYRNSEADAPTRLMFKAASFKRAMSNAALDIPGLRKTQIGRLVWVNGDKVNIYGTPQLFMTLVRMADIARTPDIRTRAILPKWCCQIDITYVTPQINAQNLANLLGAAGLLSGVGDGRQEKGALNFGQFRLTTPNDPEYVSCMKQGRVQQDRALENPAMYDVESEELFNWYNKEMARRGKVVELTDASSKKRRVA